jgi:hypothetical protein
MIIDPIELHFAQGESNKNLAITHTCTCPFTWWSSVPDNAPWLSFPATMTGDHTDIPVTIDRSRISTDSVSTYVKITSNAYGVDSVLVTAHR